MSDLLRFDPRCKPTKLETLCFWWQFLVSGAQNLDTSFWYQILVSVSGAELESCAANQYCMKLTLQ